MKSTCFFSVLFLLVKQAVPQDFGMPTTPQFEQPPQFGQYYGPPPGYPAQAPPYPGIPQPQMEGQPAPTNQQFDFINPQFFSETHRMPSKRSRKSPRKGRSRPHYRQTYLNTTFDNYTAPATNFTPDPNNPDYYSAAAENERKGPIDYYPHFSWFNRFESFPGFNNWFINLWRTGRFTHEYQYDLIDTNFFVGNPDSVGDPRFSDQEAVDLQNYEQHFSHLQKVLADERTDQEFVIEYSKERMAHERMLRLRENRNNIYQSILEMEKLIYMEQGRVINETRARNQAAENVTMTNITSALQNLTNIPFYQKKAHALDIFAS